MMIEPGWVFPQSSPRAVLLMTLVLASAAAGATALEDRIAAAPMPHAALGKGADSVKVHYARMNSNVDASKSVATLRATIRQLRDLCVAGRAKAGLPVGSPLELPAMAHGPNKDIYWSANRRITYARVYDAHIADDCSLVEQEKYTAELVSSKGRCVMDLLAHTSEGVCDPAVHAAAPAVAGPLRDGGYDAKMASMAADPRMAAIVAQAKRLTGDAGPTGETRQVLGITCEVWRVARMPDARVCLARGGSFAPSAMAGNPAQAGIVLVSENPGVSESRAVEAKLDVDMNAAIFSPLGNVGKR